MSFIYRMRNDDDYAIGWTPPKENSMNVDKQKEVLRAMFKLEHEKAIAYAKWRSTMRKLFPGFDEYKPRKKG